MNYNFVDTNLCDFTPEILAIMKGQKPERKYGYADPSMSRRINRDTIEKQTKNAHCKDGKDDGKISFKEKLSNFGKGIITPIKTMFSSPKNIAVSALSIAGGAALIALTGGAAAPIIAAAGIAGGAVQIGRGIYNQATAKTDEQAQKAWRQMGSGTFTTTASALSAKASLRAAKADTKGMSFFGAVVKCFKDIPKNIKLSFSTASHNTGSFISRFKPASQTASGNKPSDNVALLESGGKTSNHGNNPRSKSPIDSNEIINNYDFDIIDADGNVIYQAPKSSEVIQRSSTRVNNKVKAKAIPAPKKRLALPQAQSESTCPPPAPKHFSLINSIKKIINMKVFGFFKPKGK